MGPWHQEPWLLVSLITFLSQTRCLFKSGANSSKYGHTFNLVCFKSLDKYMARKPQAMILNNPFQGAVLHIGESAIF